MKIKLFVLIVLTALAGCAAKNDMEEMGMSDHMKEMKYSTSDEKMTDMQDMNGMHDMDGMMKDKMDKAKLMHDMKGQKPEHVSTF